MYTRCIPKYCPRNGKTSTTKRILRKTVDSVATPDCYLGSIQPKVQLLHFRFDSCDIYGKFRNFIFSAIYIHRSIHRESVREYWIYTKWYNTLYTDGIVFSLKVYIIHVSFFLHAFIRSLLQMNTHDVRFTLF